MARILDHRRALELRKLGKSYGQIKRELGISKSTLSEWLRKYPLTKNQIDALRGRNEIRIEKYRQTRRKTRELLFKKQYQQEEYNLPRIPVRILYVCGLFLYMGEGGKADNSTVNVSNTDPSIVLIFLYWLTRALGVKKNDIKVGIHLYEDMNVESSLGFWSKTLNLPRSQFIKPYIKKSRRVNIDQKGFGYGTCELYVYSVVLKRKILAAMQVLKDQYRDLWYNEGISRRP